MGLISPEDAEGWTSRKSWLFLAFGVAGILFVSDDIIGLVSGGGLFSVTSALDAARAHASDVDVDNAGLRTLFVVACGPAVLAAGLQLNLNPRRKLIAALALLTVFGGGFVLDAVFDADIVAGALGQYGYRRCLAHDHAVGVGKSRIRFDNYVSNGINCPSASTELVALPSELPPDPRWQLPRPARSIGSPAGWFTQDDYPALALRQGLEGRVTIRFVVGANGKVERCNVVRSSGSPLLDATSCGVLATNGRYWPARDASGEPVAQTGTKKVLWRMPTD